jgi:hypothetical protein
LLLGSIEDSLVGIAEKLVIAGYASTSFCRNCTNLFDWVMAMRAGLFKESRMVSYRGAIDGLELPAHEDVVVRRGDRCSFYQPRKRQDGGYKEFSPHVKEAYREAGFIDPGLFGKVY